MKTSLESNIECLGCHRTFPLVALLDASFDHWPRLEVIQTRTPCCGGKEEIRVSKGLIERGYVYAAGAPHFSSEQQFRVDDLSIETTEGAVVLVYGDRRTVVPSTSS